MRTLMEPTLEEFTELINMVREKHKAANYIATSNVDLILRFVLLHSIARECVVRVILASEATWENAFKRGSIIVRDPNPLVLAKLFSLGADKSLLEFLIHTRLEIEHLAFELRKRLDSSKKGWELARLMKGFTPLESVVVLFRALGVKRITACK